MDPVMVILVVVLLFWLMGAFVVPVGSSLIHGLLVVALVLFIYRMLRRG